MLKPPPSPTLPTEQRAVEPLQQPCTWKEDTAAELESWKALLSQELVSAETH